MAIAFLRLKRPRLRTIILAAVATIAVTPVLADMAVFDGTAIGKAIDELNELKKETANQLEQLEQLKQQVSFLNDISSFAKSTMNAVGNAASFVLPLTDLDSIKSQIAGDAQCLMPDGLGWGINTKNVNLFSICGMASQYKTALFTSAKGLTGLTYDQQSAQRQAVLTHRTALLGDTTTRALAQADVQINAAASMNKAADSLQADLDQAQTLQDREHVTAQILLALLRGQAQQTQLMAQSLKLQGAVAASGLPTEQVDAPPADSSSGSGQ